MSWPRTGDEVLARIAAAVEGVLVVVGGRWNLCAYDVLGERVDAVPLGFDGAERLPKALLVDPPARGILQRAARGPTVLGGLYELVITDDPLAFLRFAETALVTARRGVLGINPSIWPHDAAEEIFLANTERFVVRVWDRGLRERTVDRLRCGGTEVHVLSDRASRELGITSDHDLFETCDRHGLAAFDPFELTEKVGQETDDSLDARYRPRQVERTIVRDVANVSEVVDQATKVLAERDGGLFRRGLDLVRVMPIVADDDEVSAPVDVAVRRSVGANTIRRVTAPHLVDRLTRVAKFMRLDRRSDTWLERPPGMAVVRAVLERGDWPGVRHLRGLAESPVLRPDGSILCSPGYDAATGLFLSTGDIHPVVPEAPTLEQAREALEVLHDVVVDFPFAMSAHRAGWVASLLTVLSRPAIDGPIPGFLIEANVPGVGKGKLVNIVSLIATGRPAPVTPHSEREEEMRKLATTLVVAGDPIILIDNIKGKIGGAAVEALLTSGGEWRDRLLGKNERTSIPMLAVVFATSNNASVTFDMIRRLVHIRMMSYSEEPECRADFRHSNLEAWVVRNRANLLGAGLTILRGYAAAGRPHVGLQPLGSFESWSRVVRDALVWAGDVDPLDATRGLRDSAVGDEVAALRAMISGIEIVARREATSRGLAYPKQLAGVTAATILRAAYDDRPGADVPGLLEAVETLCSSRASRGGQVLVNAFGTMLRSYEDKPVEGRYVSRVGTDGHSKLRLWGVKSVDG